MNYVLEDRWGKVWWKRLCPKCHSARRLARRHNLFMEGVPGPCRLGRSCLPDRCGDRGRPPVRQTAFSTDQVFQRDELMSAFQEHKEELEHYEQMFGRERGRLAVSLDRITNALVLAGQHGVYC